MFVKSKRSANHLGNIIGPRVSDKSITYVSDKFSIACNTLLNTFSHLSYDVKFKLFKSYCIHWDLSSIHVQTFYKQWRKGIRRVFGVSKNSLLRCSDIPIETQLCKIILNFYCKIHESSNTLVQLCGRQLLHNSDSNASRSLAHIAEKVGKNKEYVMSRADEVRSLLNVEYSEETQRLVHFILDLIGIRESGSSDMAKEDITDILDYLCAK